ncbi:hypothetical protein PV325_005898 [Microctonus aethiopoides]|uniref:Uncharacterized protein n=1 Tax=Microctonus aethiopoides TaxID=144406 RepID=A0AA39KRV1_9HYME|nr:hypothetical protein PV325_005898 [Microctonus aethiopoides]KAK0097355.1 hypothetical protein PV326_002344 [Microctonus aethiopoides]KAK0171520.1 hypothetical protein PV328_004967 [Microctonus aethiopoides]
MKLLQYIGPLVILLLITESQAGILRDIHNKNKEHLAAILDPLGIFRNKDGNNGGSVNAQAESSSINQNLNLGPIRFSTSLNHASASSNANSGSGSVISNADAVTNGGDYENGYSKAVANVNLITNTNIDANNGRYNNGYRNIRNGVHHSEYNSVQNGRYGVENNGALFTSENTGGWNRGHVEYSNDGDGDERYSNDGVNSASSSASSYVGIDGKTHTITNTKTHGDARADATAKAVAHDSYGGKAHNNLRFDHGITRPYGMNFEFNGDKKSENFVDNNQYYRDNPFLTNVDENANTNANVQTGPYDNGDKISSYVNGQVQQLNQGELFLGRGEREPYYEKRHNADVDWNDALSINSNFNAANNFRVVSDVYSENNNANNYEGSYKSGSYGTINTDNIKTSWLNEPNKQLYNAANSGDLVIDDGYRGNQKTSSVANDHVSDIANKPDALKNHEKHGMLIGNEYSKSNIQGNFNIPGLTTVNASATGTISGHARAIANAEVSAGGNVVASATANANINIDPEFSSKSSTLAKTSVIADTSKMLIFSN